MSPFFITLVRRETSSSCGSSSSSTNEKDREVKSWRSRFFNMSPLYYLGLLVFCILLTLAVALPLRKPPPSFSNGLQVNLGYTTYVGTQLPNSVNQFLGMRYASPPTGDLRWRAPVEPEADGATHNADKVTYLLLAPPMQFTHEMSISLRSRFVVVQTHLFWHL